jgi:SOS-response transcriptional repressor LexA
MPSLGNRIRSERKALGISGEELGKRIGGVGKSSVSQWESNQVSGISHESFVKMSEIFGVNIHWLMTGDGERSNKKGKLNEQENKYSSIHGSVPMMNDTALAQLYNEQPGKYRPSSWLPCPVAHDENTFAITVRSDAMVSNTPGHRSYPIGSVLFVDPSLTPECGNKVIAIRKSDSLVTFKEFKSDFGVAVLSPLNDQYPTIIMDDDIKVIGVVIGCFLPEHLGEKSPH